MSIPGANKGDLLEVTNKDNRYYGKVVEVLDVLRAQGGNRKSETGAYRVYKCITEKGYVLMLSPSEVKRSTRENIGNPKLGDIVPLGKIRVARRDFLKSVGADNRDEQWGLLVAHTNREGECTGISLGCHDIEADAIAEILDRLSEIGLAFCGADAMERAKD